MGGTGIHRRGDSLMTRKWISGLLRARQVQEDVARERLAHARLHAQDARLRVRADDARVQAMLEETSPQSTQAFLASASARQAAGATLAAAQWIRATAEDQVTIRQTSVVAAARQRRSAEKLAERDANELHARAAAALQHELDDVAGRPRHEDEAVAGG